MAEKENLQVVDKWIEAVNAHNLTVLAKYRGPEYLWEGPGPPGTEGADREDSYMKKAYQAFPDLHVEVLSRIAAGDFVWINGLITATKRGPVTSADGQTPNATGKKMNMPFSERLEFRNGKVVRNSMHSDRLEQMARLGLMPEV
jgi:predicted ester cyclase